jgi:hypothetical protein
MNELAPFMIRYLYGNAGIEEIHNDIDRWHNEPITDAPELHDFLGLWPAEYAMFVEHEWKFVRYLDHLKNDQG